MQTHIIFDFFGTLVDYSSERRARDYSRTREVLRRLGSTMSDDEFIDSWTHLWMSFEMRSQLDHREFTMPEATAAYLSETLGRAPTDAETAELIQAYLPEWNAGVYHLDGLADWVRGLAQSYRLAIVSNTHEPYLVPNHLAKMGLSDAFELIVLSVEVGWRKPHPGIYATALDGLGLRPEQAVFVGDNHQADYVGPRQAGMTAYLIDPHRRVAGVPDEHRLDSIFQLSERLSRPSPG